MNVEAQINDNIIWASVKTTKTLSAKTSLYFAPILRLNNDITSYQNSSIDFAINYKLSSNWHLQLLSRTWFIPDEPGRQFAWLDVGYRTPIGKYNLSSHARLHLALDINERDDPDYLRWKTTFYFPKWKNLTPHLAIEPWLRINDNMQLQRMRYEPGIIIGLKNNLRLNLVYRREDSVNLLPYRRFNMFVITMIFNN